MYDEYMSIQYRNWFNDSCQRVVYGLSSDEERNVHRCGTRTIRSVIIPLSLLLIFSTSAIHLVYSAATNPLNKTNELWEFRWEPVCILLVSLVWVLLHLRFLPGRRYDGPVCGNGLRPKYKRNGFAFFVLTFAAVGVLTFYSGPSVFAVLPGLCTVTVVVSLFASLAVYAKACLVPNSSQCSPRTQPILDVFYGLELYPKIGDLHLKQTSIRLGAVLNLLVLWSCFFAQLKPSYVATVIIAIQFLHAARRFWNEECYAHSMEVSHYNLGLQEMFRHLVFKPFILNVATISSVFRPPSSGIVVLIVVFLTATVSIVLTYMVDRQKFLVKLKKGKCMTWGRTSSTIHAFYEDGHGLRRASILLYSGFWGLARHLNYTLEFITYSALATPTLFNLNWFGLLPPTLILVSLLYRGQEDFKKCRRKYGPYWILYCRKVPHTYIPWLW